MAPAAKIVFFIGFRFICLGFLHTTRFALIPIFWNYFEADVWCLFVLLPKHEFYYPWFDLLCL